MRCFPGVEQLLDAAQPLSRFLPLQCVQHSAGFRLPHHHLGADRESEPGTICGNNGNYTGRTRSQDSNRVPRSSPHDLTCSRLICAVRLART